MARKTTKRSPIRQSTKRFLREPLTDFNKMMTRRVHMRMPKYDPGIEPGFVIDRSHFMEKVKSVPEKAS